MLFFSLVGDSYNINQYIKKIYKSYHRFTLA